MATNKIYTDIDKTLNPPIILIILKPFLIRTGRLNRSNSHKKEFANNLLDVRRFYNKFYEYKRDEINQTDFYDKLRRFNRMKKISIDDLHLLIFSFIDQEIFYECYETLRDIISNFIGDIKSLGKIVKIRKKLVSELRRVNYPNFPLIVEKQYIIDKLKEMRLMDKNWLMYALIPDYLMQPWLANLWGKSVDTLSDYVLKIQTKQELYQNIASFGKGYWNIGASAAFSSIYEKRVQDPLWDRIVTDYEDKLIQIILYINDVGLLNF
ncbi:DgyrCDS11862 [Dimorphilus gyrociliatus]|uniref:DgyrCDS11862 n=1 Tax=Dimorphilus gyrociliatus TaxID=2664684 RepID=A0A7I8W6L1_9ANNE|nr:DgyrCDS11862 [Dimorphilus gyrociliatus]